MNEILEDPKCFVREAGREGLIRNKGKLDASVCISKKEMQCPQCNESDLCSSITMF